MKIWIKNNYGETLEVSIKDNATVKDLLEKLYEDNDILAANIPLESYMQAVFFTDDHLGLLQKNTQLMNGASLMLKVSPNLALFSPLKPEELAKLSTNIPEHFYCPISKQVLLDPVIFPVKSLIIRKTNDEEISETLVINRTLERECLSMAYKTNGKCPFTRRELDNGEICNLETDNLLLEEINSFYARLENSIYYAPLKAEQYEPVEYITPTSDSEDEYEAHEEVPIEIVREIIARLYSLDTGPEARNLSVSEIYQLPPRSDESPNENTTSANEPSQIQRNPTASTNIGVRRVTFWTAPETEDEHVGLSPVP